MKKEDQVVIEEILGTSERTAEFIKRLDGWIQEMNHPASYYRKVEISKPRTAKAYQQVDAARKAAEKLQVRIESIRDTHSYRNPLDLAEINALSERVCEGANYLSSLAERVRPIGSTRQDKRLYTQRYALRGLMWLFKRYLPDEKISYVPRSHFYRIADCMLSEIGHERVDLWDLIKQEIPSFLQDLEICPITGNDDVMVILMEP